MKEEYLNVVIVEDSMMDYELIVRNLRKSFSNLSTSIVSNAEDLTAALENKHTDIVLSDFNVPGFGALPALEVLKTKWRQEIPLIVVSGAVGDEKAAEVIKAGASDFVMKNNLQRLAPAMKQAITDFENKRLESNRRKQAEEASSKRMHGLAVASHDLKNPLNAIQISIELIRKNLNTPDGAEKVDGYLTRMDKAVVRIKSLISDYIDQTRLDAGSFEINKTTSRIDLLLNEINEVFSPIAEKKGVKFIVSSPGGETFAYFDYPRLFQALLNIVGNAFKFTESSGTVTVKIGGVNTPELLLEVSDTGVGIENEFIPLIFKRFWQHKSSSPKEKGSAGLGLSIAKGIIDAHGGTIQVFSAPNKGTTFKILIPNEPQEKDTSALFSFSRGSRNVILVEDDIDLKEIFTELLVNEGFNVTSFDHGERALEYITKSQSPIDLIILDYQLPGLNGFELVTKIQQLPRNMSRVPIIVTSAEMNLAQTFGNNHDLVFVKKPIAINNFMKAVESAIKDDK